MSVSAFMGPHAHRASSPVPAVGAAAGGSRSRNTTSEIPDGLTSVLARHRASEWRGARGEQLRLRVVVEHAETSGRTFTYLLRVDASDDLVEWSTQRRHGITVGERLALSGLVKAHTTRDATRVTVLRDCFNPLRMT